MSFDWAWAAAIAGGIWSGVKTISFVGEGELGVLLTFGKAKRDQDGQVRVWGPGFRPLIPFVQKIAKIHIQKNTLWFENMQVTMGDNLTYTFDAYISYHISTEPQWIEHVLFTLEDSQEFVGVVFRTTIQDLLWKNKESDMQAIAKKLLANVSKKLSDDGIIVDACGISSFAETSVSQTFRGIDYRILKAKENLGVLPECVLAAAIGAMPTVSTTECSPVTVETSDYVE